ncbi:molybdenum cofactor biosynthesis protein MoaE [Methanobacterium sp.]|uniref:molybdenum cofactor biosynthesis protein MoaE n=1 Tax=Methanobacterium sp. TaxID=2164 RepID=UPI003C70E180
MALNVRVIKKDEEIITIPDLINQVKKNPKIDECGAVFSFEGIVRGKENETKVKKLNLSTPDIQKTEKELKEIIKEVKNKHGVAEIAAVHYVGEFYTGDSLLLVVVAGAHRGETLDALKESIERVKFDLEFKKEEFTEEGKNIIMSGG